MICLTWITIREDYTIFRRRSGDELKGPFRGTGGRSPQQVGAEQETPLPLLDFAVSAFKRTHQMGNAAIPCGGKRNDR